MKVLYRHHCGYIDPTQVVQRPKLRAQTHWLGKACRYQAVRQPEIPEALLEEVALSSTTLGPAWGCDRPRLQEPLSEVCMHLESLLRPCGLFLARASSAD